jgi:hypothetical protein
LRNNEFAVPDPVSVTPFELLMTASSDAVGATPDSQSAPVDQSPVTPVFHVTDATNELLLLFDMLPLIPNGGSS